MMAKVLIKPMTKKEQLKVAFKVMLKDLMDKFVPESYGSVGAEVSGIVRQEISNTADLMVKEVSIRTDLR